MRLPPVRSGWLEVVCGPMFSGKSEELLRRVRRAELDGQRVGVHKPALDRRYAVSEIVSHGGARRPAVPIAVPAALLDAARGLDVVGLDEAQFLDDSVVGVVERLVAGGRRVIVAGLDRDFRGEPFGPMPALLARADLVEKRQAVCAVCGGPAGMTQRLLDGLPAPFGGATVVVGGHERYEARCRACYRAGPDAVPPDRLPTAG